MKTFVALFALALWTPTLALAQEIHFVGGAWPSDFYAKLMLFLGPKFMVSYSVGSRYHYLYPANEKNPSGIKPEIIVLDLLPANWHTWSKTINSFVPEGRSKVGSLSSNPAYVYLVIPRSDSKSSPALTTQYVPLLKQIARESGANIIDLNDPAFHTADSQADALRKLYVTFARVQRNPGTWHAVRATSEQSDEGPAKNAIDDNPDTYWHTRYDPNPTKVPHEIVIDLGKDETLAGFCYLARQDGGVNGRVKDFEVYLGDDPDHWAGPVLKGTLQNSMNEQRLLFDHSATGRYLRFRALSEVNGNIWTSVAEIGVLPSGNSR